MNVHDVNLRHQTIRCDWRTNDGANGNVDDQVKTFGERNISNQNVLLHGMLLQSFEQADEMFAGAVERFR